MRSVRGRQGGIPLKTLMEKKKKQFSSSLPGKVKIASPIQGEPVINWQKCGPNMHWGKRNTHSTVSMWVEALLIWEWHFDSSYILFTCSFLSSLSRENLGFISKGNLGKSLWLINISPNLSLLSTSKIKPS